ncbi:LOW QUALITY PROTEIN: protein WWC3-like [Delphinus delphis]|uniref:LOW QUALITY PROTEIN: protein WWC3-like n=1 Tax=Delphinus delphis TaxID=9728 RepID=UPI0037511308
MALSSFFLRGLAHPCRASAAHSPQAVALQAPPTSRWPDELSSWSTNVRPSLVLYRSDSDSSMLARKSPLVRNTLERRTLRYKQVVITADSLLSLARYRSGGLNPCGPHPCCVGVGPRCGCLSPVGSVTRGRSCGKGAGGVGALTAAVSQPCRSSLAALAARTSLDLELDLQASRTRQRQLTEELCDLRELRQRLEDAQLRGHAEPPAWLLRDERFRSLLREAERQTRQTKLDFHQEQAAEKTLKKASKGVCQLRGRNLKEPIQLGAGVQGEDNIFHETTG